MDARTQPLLAEVHALYARPAGFSDRRRQMTHTASTDVADGFAPPRVAAPARKVVVLLGADREAAAHARVLLDVLRELAREVVVVAPPGTDGFDGPDVGVVHLDCEPRWRNPLRSAAQAWKLARRIAAERPDTVHVVGLAPAALACLMLRAAPAQSTVVHLPDLAVLGSHALSWSRSWPWRRLALRLLASRLARPDAFLLVGSEDDLGELRALGIDPGPRFAIVGGPGVDPEVFPVLPPTQGAMPVAAFVGPVTEAGGIRDLLAAFERLWARGLRLQLEIYGAPGIAGAADSPGGLSADWARWGLHPGVRCAAAWPADTREVWRRAEICVWPAQARHGLPRALLEAAACGRALLVTDAATGRSFVRDGVEGLVVPERNDQALGEALEHLARDAALRQRLGAAARLRVVQSFTEAHVKEALRGVYLSLPAPARRLRHQPSSN